MFEVQDVPSLSYGMTRRRKPTSVHTGGAMFALATALPPMGAGFSEKLAKEASLLEIAHNRLGDAFFTLKDRQGLVLGDVRIALV